MDRDRSPLRGRPAFGGRSAAREEREEAPRTMEIYHNRQLDGKPMKCTMVGANNAAGTTGGATMALPKIEYPAGKERKGPAPDMDSIHRALFNKKSAPGKKQTFTITMPKKTK